MSLRVGLVTPVERQGGSSGVGRYIQSLTEALAALRRDPECSLPALEYVVLTSANNTTWIPSSVREEMTVVTRTRPTDADFADLSLDVVHFLVPRYAATDRATLFNPYDLRHRAHPEGLKRRILQERESHLSQGCQEATIVDTPSQAVADEVVETYGVDPDAVQPLPLGPTVTPGDADPDSLVAAVESAFDLPDSFALFPAKTWPHKNHRRLLESLTHVREAHDETIPLVCTGNRTTPWVDADHAVGDLDAHPDVQDLGYVDVSHLRGLYHRCELVVFPSLYEGGGLPVLEAWQFDAPVVCADIPPLREKAGEAAAYFDPTDAAAIGDTLHAVWTDEAVRAGLVDCARDRRGQFTWARTARMYHALYRRAAGQELSPADRAALDYPAGE